MMFKFYIPFDKLADQLLNGFKAKVSFPLEKLTLKVILDDGSVKNFESIEVTVHEGNATES